MPRLSTDGFSVLDDDQYRKILKAYASIGGDEYLDRAQKLIENAPNDACIDWIQVQDLVEQHKQAMEGSTSSSRGERLREGISLRDWLISSFRIRRLF